MKRLYRAGELEKTTQVLRLEDLRQPIHVSTGHLEAATTEELHDLITDISHELGRRAAEPAGAA